MGLRFAAVLVAFFIFSFIKYKINNRKVIDFIIGVSITGLVVIYTAPIKHTTQLLIASSLFAIISASYLNFGKIIYKIIDKIKSNIEQRKRR